MLEPWWQLESVRLAQEKPGSEIAWPKKSLAQEEPGSGLCCTLQRMAHLLQMELMFSHQTVLVVQADLGTALCRMQCHSTPGRSSVDVHHIESCFWPGGDGKREK